MDENEIRNFEIGQDLLSISIDNKLNILKDLEGFKKSIDLDKATFIRNQEIFELQMKLF
jgi:hypothetical protein